MKVIGLISGTSMDGIDAALTEINGCPPEISIQLLSYQDFPYPPGVKERIRLVASPDSSRVDQICHLNAYLGELFARAASRLLAEAEADPAEVKLIGSHGQTIHHLPGPAGEEIPGDRFEIRSSLQIGEGAVIAERTGITTISNFRARDLAAGGLGAPLLPYLHFLLFRPAQENRIVLNIGGIANLTLIPGTGGLESVSAFDTGPGNLIIDGLVRKASAGREEFDRDGEMARAGQINQDLLDFLLRHPFISQPPPKAAERESFAGSYLEELWNRVRQKHISPPSAVRTATLAVAESIALNFRRFVLPDSPARRAVVCGGGARNPVLLESLSRALPEIEFASSRNYGIDPKAVEAVGFALLAYETWHRRPGNLPRVTGADRPVILGCIFPQPEERED